MRCSVAVCGLCTQRLPPCCPRAQSRVPVAYRLLIDPGWLELPNLVIIVHSVHSLPDGRPLAHVSFLDYRMACNLIGGWQWVNKGIGKRCGAAASA